jgi:hypothetical protein
MGKIKQGILGGFSGKVGPVIGTSWKGKAVMRAIALSHNDANSVAQQQQRLKFKLLIQFLAEVNGFIERGFRNRAVGMTAPNAAMRLNLDGAISGDWPNYKVAYDKVMVSNGVIDLIRSGVINGSRKTLHRGKVIVTFIMGTRELYDFVDENPDVEFHPVDYVNNPLVIAKNDRMVSINSCLEVDLMGQVASETIGMRQYSGIGGQIDFVRGASMAREGKSIIAMPSTAAGGTISRIKPFLTPGSAVSTTRNDVNYLVTEYGIARLKGRTLQHRAEDLIQIAHPDFRPMLIEEYERRFQCKFPA